MSPSAQRRAPARARPPAPEAQRILDAAERIFAEHGYEGARMQDIAGSARTSLRDVYAVAKGKAEILRTLNELRAAELLSRLEDTLADESRPPVDSLNDVIAVVATFLMDHPHFLRIHLREGRAWALDASKQYFFSDLRNVSARLQESLFRRGIRAGIFHDENPRVAVATLRALEQVHLSEWVLRRGRASKRAVIEAIQRDAGRLFCR
jgi:AcrR family transcriptional regulator